MADFLGLMKQAAELKSKMEAMQAELDQHRGRGHGRRRPRHREALRQRRDEGRHDRRFADQARPRRRSSKTCSSPRMPTRAARLETLLQEKMQALTGGLPLPPGMKLF